MKFTQLIFISLGMGSALILLWIGVVLTLSF
jgi:hypothetical protein